MAPSSVNQLHLTTLAIVVEKRSYTRAAEILGITQPSVSQQIRDLERACGAPLLVQQGRTLVPTSLGEQLAKIGLELRNQMERAAKTVADHASGVAGRLTIGASMTTAVTVVPNAIVALQKISPDVTVSVRIANTADIAQAVVDETVDVGVVETSVKRDELVTKTFADDVLACIVSKSHAFSGRGTTLQALVRETLLIREPGSGTREVLEHELHKTGACFARQIELNDPQAILASVAAGVGIAWISERLALSQPDLGIVSVADFTLSRPFSTIHRRDRRPSPAVEAFLDAVRSTYRKRRRLSGIKSSKA